MADKVLCDKSDLVNIADAVRSKLGVTDTYYVSELSSAIQNIQTGGITPSGTISITENGTVDVSQYANAEVNVNSSPSLQSKSVTYTSNGTATITPDEGYDGLSSVDVTVNVSGGGSIGEIFSGEVIPTKETPPSELFVTLPNGEQMTITDLWSSSVDNIWNKIVLNGDAVSFSIINTTDSHVYTGTQIKQINIDFYKYQGTKDNRVWRRCLNGASYNSISDTLCFKTGSKYVYYWI